MDLRGIATDDSSSLNSQNTNNLISASTPAPALAVPSPPVQATCIVIAQPVPKYFPSLRVPEMQTQGQNVGHR